MPNLSVCTLKFAILEALASGGHQHKFNLIGKDYHPGGLESRLGVRFDAAQRHTAVVAFDSLKVAGLIQPSYSDLVDPDSWVEVTDAGRRALERRELDALDVALARVALNLVEVREGAWASVMSGLPDSSRQASHSARELIDQVLKQGAPDADVRGMSGFVEDRTSTNGITRRHRLRYLMGKYRSTASDSELRVAEQACEFVLATDDRLKALAHSRKPVPVSDVRDALQAAEIALRRILLPDDADRLRRALDSKEC